MRDKDKETPKVSHEFRSKQDKKNKDQKQTKNESE